MTGIDRARVTAKDAARLADIALTTVDGITPVPVDRTALAHSPNAARAMGARVEEVLAGEDRRAAALCLAHARLRPERIALELLAILAHARVDAAAWLAIQERVDHVLIPGGHAANVMSTEADADGVIDAHAHFGGDRYRTPTGYHDVPAACLPHTAAAAIVGMPLRKVASHPALDGFDRVVTEVRREETHVEIHHDDPRPTIALADLDASLLWPDPDAVARIHDLARATTTG